MSEAEAKAVQPIVQQRQASFGSSTTPLTWGVSHNYRVLGFTSTQRALFMKVQQFLLPAYLYAVQPSQRHIML